VAAVALAERRQPEKLRVGVFADAPAQPRWMVEALARIAASEFAEVRLVEAGDASPPRKSLLWEAYNALDRRVFGADPTDLLSLDVLPSFTGDAPLDVAFVLGNLDDADFARRARYGAWRFQADGLREVIDDVPVTGSGVTVRLPGSRAARIAYRSWSRTYPFSVARNRDQVLRKTGEFAARALRELHGSGPGWLERCKEVPVSADSQSPRAGELSRVLTRMGRRAIDKALHIEQWFLAFKFKASLIAPDLAGFTRLVPPKDRDWADPFVLEKNGRWFVFFEELPYAAGKAHISMMEIDAAGRCSKPVRCIERDYHLSYPFVFEHDGDLYMLPETAKNRTLELWRCVDFPTRWKLERTLMEGVRMVDATLHRAASRWWLFANCAPGDSRIYDDELNLFHAESLDGDWHPHPANPVKSDARSARPAGRLFTRDGQLYRPAQVCVPRYGAGIALHRVTKLTPGEFSERQVARLLPPETSGLLGLHTMNHAGDLTVVDAFARRRRL
jgi:hypothetical protein